MDPNQALVDARGALSDIHARERLKVDGDLPPPVLELIAAFEALDGWLSKGGFLPSAWAPVEPKH